jgi:hypothetical protein
MYLYFLFHGTLRPLLDVSVFLLKQKYKRTIYRSFRMKTIFRKINNFFFMGVLICASIFPADNGYASPHDGHDGCFDMKIRFTLKTTLHPDGSATVSGPAEGGLLHHDATLDLFVRAEDIQVGLGEMAPTSTVIVLAKGAYTLRNGDKIFIDVFNVTDYLAGRTVGIQTITGGTGYFEGATGYLPGKGIIDGDVRRSEVEGTICLGN